MLHLLDQILRRCAAGEAVAVCTLVRTRGSTPQRTGAMMVVLQDGQTLGTIGGGCVEAEVRTRALELLTTGAGRLLSFKLDHDLGWDDGLVCGGTMDVAVQVIDSPEAAGPLQTARDQLAGHATAMLPITVPNERGEPVRFDQEIQPSPVLLIAGAGHVGVALAEIARRLDFAVTVIDDRSDFVTPARFPDATRIIGPIDAELSRQPINEHSYIVIVTRGHRNDASALAAAVATPARYIGLIGSKRKIVTIFQDLHRQGVPEDVLRKVHAPIGLDIAAVTPAEIAVSIAAELIAVRRGAPEGAMGPMRMCAGQLDRLFTADLSVNEPA